MKNVENQTISIAILGTNQGIKYRLMEQIRQSLAGNKQTDTILTDNKCKHDTKQQKSQKCNITKYSNIKSTNLGKLMLTTTPGCKYLKNTIRGISQSQFAILIISEQDIHNRASIHTYVMLCCIFGIYMIFVCFDCHQVTQSEWARAADVVLDVVKNVGYKGRCQFIPICGCCPINIIPNNNNWFQGNSLIQQIRKLESPLSQKQKQKPLRIPIRNVYQKPGIGTILTGTIKYGTLKKTSRLAISPGNIRAEIKSIYVNNNSEQTIALPGQSVGINIVIKKNITVKRGFVIGDQNDPPEPVSCFIGKVIITNTKIPIKQGHIVKIHIHTCHFSCTITQITKFPIHKQKQQAKQKKQVDQQKQKQSQEQKLQNRDNAFVLFKINKEVVIQLFEKYKLLGRFCIVDNGYVIGGGIVVSKNVSKL